MKPRIFISAVTSELRATRQLVANVLLRLGYDPVMQDIFGTESGDLRQVLRAKIDDCDGLIQLVGRGYGAEPPTVGTEFAADGFTRVSYTQFEFLYARARGKKTWLIYTDEGCTLDHPLEELDLPFRTGAATNAVADAASVGSDAGSIRHDQLTHPDPAGYQSERRALQDAWRQRWKQEGHLRHGATSDTELELKVERLKDEFAELRRAEHAWRRKVAWSMAAIAALVLLSVGVGMYVAEKQRQAANVVQLAADEAAKEAKIAADRAKLNQQKTEQKIESSTQEAKEGIKVEIQNAVHELTNPIVLAERIRKEIHATAEEKIKALPDEKGRGLLIAEIEKERDLALGRVDDLIKLIQERLKEGASPVFQRAAEILQKEGTDEALAYLESRRPSTLETARRHAEQAKTAQARADAEKELRNKSLQALVLEAELLETKLQWQPALELREQVAELAPDWFEARNRLGLLNLKLARFQAAKPHLQAAVKLAIAPDEEAVALNNLAQLLQATNCLTEAEPLMRRALEIRQQCYGAEHPTVAIDLNNLVQLLRATNRLAEAEPLMRRALVIREQSYGSEHPTVALALNTLAQVLSDTNRLAVAEPLMRRALAIRERSYGADHESAAVPLNNLAQLLQTTNRREEAEPLMRRALEIHEQSYGTKHPSVARDLNDLAELLRATNRLGESEPLMRRALASDEQSFGAAHPRVAVRLSNLAQLLQDTDRMAEAEPLMRRVLAIDEQSYGVGHPEFAIDLNNLGLLLKATNRLAEAEPLMRRALAIDEQSYGAEHPNVARDLNNLATLLQDTNRLAEAEPPIRRCVTIFHEFGRKTGHEHPGMQTVLANYREILQAMKFAEDEIDRRVKDATVVAGRLKPILPEVERLLGPAQPVAEVLAALDRQYRVDGKPDVYFLKPNQPMAPHLDELFKANPDFLNAAGVAAVRRGDHATGVAHFEESLKLLAGQPDDVATAFTTRMNLASALRELGEVEQARDELRKLLSGLRDGDTITAFSKGRARYHLALCEWRLNDREAAQREAEESLNLYGDDADAAPQKKQTEQLLAVLKENEPLPPLAKVDAVAALEQARVRFRARAELATLPLTQSALPLLDQMLGSAESTQQVFEQLDRQYREQGKPAIWFLPISEPISPHLDELLGPIPVAEEGDSSTAQ